MASAATRFGTQAFAEADMVNLYNFAVRVPTGLLDNLCQVHFAVVPAALLRARPVDFGSLAKLDAKHPYVKVALAMGMYLGVIASGGGNLKRQAGGVAAFCPGLNKQVLTNLATNVAWQTKAEQFLKTVLAHYKVDMAAVYPKGLLHARGKLFHRISQLLLKWPAAEVSVASALAKIEGKYSQEMWACGAFEHAPEPLYPAPVIVETLVEEKGAEAKKKPKKEAEGPRILAEDSEADPTAASASAPISAEDLDSAPISAEDSEKFKELFASDAEDGDEAPASASAAASAPAAEQSASAAAPAAYAYRVKHEGFRRVNQEPLAEWTERLWRRVAEQGLMHMLLKYKQCAEAVEVQVLEASAPIVFQARALKPFKPKELVLTPCTPAELMSFSDGGKLKRPKTLHPHLPFAVECLAGALEVEDTSRFFLKSPLASAAIPDKIASPFWAVLQAQNEAHANMVVSVCTFTVPSFSFSVEGEPKPRAGAKRPRPMPLTVQVPALTNSKPLVREEVLVFTGSLALPAEEEDEG